MQTKKHRKYKDTKTYKKRGGVKSPVRLKKGVQLQLNRFNPLNDINTQRKNHLIAFLRARLWGAAVRYYFLLVNMVFLTCEAVYIDNHKLTNSVDGEKILLLDDIKHFGVETHLTDDKLPNNHKYKYKFIFHFKVNDISPTKEFAICIRYQDVKKLIKNSISNISNTMTMKPMEKIKSQLMYVEDIYKKENDGNWTLTKEHIMPRKVQYTVQCGENPDASDTQIHSL